MNETATNYESKQYTGHTLAWAQYGRVEILHLLKGKRDSIGPWAKSLCGSQANANGWHTTDSEISQGWRLCAKCEQSYTKTHERAKRPERVERTKSFLLVTQYDDGSTFSDYFVSEGAAKRFVAEAKKYERKLREHNTQTRGLRFIDSYTITDVDAQACADCANKRDECSCVTNDDEDEGSN